MLEKLKNHVILTKNPNIDPKSRKYQKKSGNFRKFLGTPVETPVGTPVEGWVPPRPPMALQSCPVAVQESRTCPMAVQESRTCPVAVQDQQLRLRAKLYKQKHKPLYFPGNKEQDFFRKDLSSWTATGQVWTGQSLDRSWTATGQVLDSWEAAGQVLDCWKATGQVLES